MPTQTELEFRAARGGQTQNSALRRILQSRPSIWIPMPWLARQIKAYAVHSRIADCRSKFGMTIHHKNKRLPNGQNASYYKYEPAGAQTIDPPHSG